jgi:hypothetical protein
MKSPGQSIDRSTWLSAARGMTMSGLNEEERLQARALADIGLLYPVAVSARQRGEGGEISAINRPVDDADFVLRLANRLAHHRRADEAGASCHQKRQ